jgi:hypothetical protein
MGKNAWVIGLVLVWFMLGCSLSNLLPSANTVNTETLDPDDFLSAQEQIAIHLGFRGAAGGFSEDDTNGDGQPDQIMIRYPEEEIIPGVYTRSSLIFAFDNFAPNPRQMVVEFANFTGEEQAFVFELKIPKYFAGSVDEVAFSLQPDEIINPDPDVKYYLVASGDSPDWGTGLQVAGLVNNAIVTYTEAQKKLKESAATDLAGVCQKLKLPENQNACWLSLVEDYSDVLTLEQKYNYCKNTSGLTKMMCASLVNDNADECKYAQNDEDQMVCRGYYVLAKCRNLSGGEYQNCLKTTAIASKAPLACLDLEDEDIQNECVALASKDPEFCKQIVNDARKESCQKTLGVKTGLPWEPLGGKGSDQEWFTGDQAAKDCEYFHGSFSAYTTDYALGEYFHDVNKLSCAFTVKYSDGTSSEVNIWIEGYPTTQEARVIWEEQNGANSDWLKTMNERAVKESDRTVFTYNEDWYFSSYLVFTEPKNYVNDGKALYQNAIIWFIEDGMSSASNATWLYVKQAAELLIDQKNRR